MVLQKTRFSADVDPWLLAALVGILTVGALAVASTTQARFGDFQPFLIRQGAAALVGLVLAVLLFQWDYHEFKLVALWAYLLNIGLLAAVMVLGHSALGAQRWIQLGPVTLQASETAKLLGIVTLACHLDNQERLDRWQDLIPPVLHMAPIMGLVLIQPDLGTTLVFLVILVAMLYVAGVPGTRLAFITLGGLTVAAVWIALHLRYHIWLPLKEYQLNRLIVFMDTNHDTSGLGYQISEARLAIATGGLTGRGLFHGPITQLNFLPEQFTDFIFAAFTEETGFLGAAALVGLFTVLLYRIVRVGALAGDRLGALLAVGVGAMFAFHVAENVGMNLGIMPVAGIPLPFVSYGGTAMWVDLASIGLVLTVYRHRRNIQFQS